MKGPKNLIEGMSDDFVKDSLKQVTKRIRQQTIILKADRLTRGDLMYQLKKRGFTYKEIGELSGFSTTLSFREVLKYERLLKRIEKDQPGVLDRSSLY